MEAAGPSVRLFEARVARGSLMGARLLLKEYLPVARDVAQQAPALPLSSLSLPPSPSPAVCALCLVWPCARLKVLAGREIDRLINR